MNIKKIKYVLLIMIMGTILVVPQVYAKTSIEIKPNSPVYTNKTISQFFDESLAMKNAGESLEGDNVDVHMATNTDWAIVSYFSNSAYGTNGEGKNKGVTTSINGKDYLSTNGNITGIMDFGKTQTYTAGVISNYTEIVDTDTENSYTNGKSIIENANNSRHVDVKGNYSSKAVALNEWYGASLWQGNDKVYPYSGRVGLFGGSWGSLWTHLTNGAAKKDCTFRPVIFNQI